MPVIPKVSILLVVRNEENHIRRFLKSIKEQTYKNVSVYLLDNNSDDNTIAFAKNEFPSIKIETRHENMGFAIANNYLAKLAINEKSDFLFILNPDLILDSFCIENLVKLFKNDDKVGIAAPVMFNYSEDIKPGNSIINSYGTFAKFNTYKEIWPYRGKSLVNTNIPNILEVDTVGGGITLISSNAYQICGLFEPEFFIYGEEIDLGYRIKKAGFKAVTTIDAKVWRDHDSLKNNISNFAFKAYYQNRSVFLFFHKYKFIKGIILKFVNHLYRLPIVFPSLIEKGGIKLVKFYYLGIIHGLLNRGGKSKYTF